MHEAVPKWHGSCKKKIIRERITSVFVSLIERKMNNDFRKFATRKLGMDGLALDDVVKAQAQYLNPYILEERQLNVTQMDVFSRLMMDRIIFLGTEIDDYTANTLQAAALP